MRRHTLEILNETMNPKLRVYFDEQVDVVGHNFQCDDFGSILGCRLSQNLLQSLCNRLYQNRPPILWAPHDVVLAAINHIVVRLVALEHS